ncbi:MAG: hypothetical protein E7463_14650 [Ruminococcaceae bacterium]|nr:hypothetical protein [Oscillospiraceae bacterium]
MKIMDFDAYVGGWPFHKVRNRTFADLQRLHEANGIVGGCVSSTDAIFFNDPYEADYDLAQEIAGTPYRLVMTVNPSLEGTLPQLKRAMSELKPAAVRILPGFHGYKLSDSCLVPVFEFLREQGLPLYITLRGEDERMTYLFHPQPVPVEDVTAFLQRESGFAVFLSNVRLGELQEMKEQIKHRGDVFYGACGLKDGLFPVDDMYPEGMTQKLVYGSQQPLYTLLSSLLFITEAKIPEEEKTRILEGKHFLSKLKA